MKKYILMLFLFLFESAYMLADVPSNDPKVILKFSNQHEGATSVPLVLFIFREFPKNENISLSVYRPLIEEARILASFHIDDQEKIHVEYGEIDFLAVPGIGFFRGERALFSFHTAERELVGLSLIPHQINAENAEHDMLLTAELMALYPAMYKLSIQGIKEGESYILHSDSGEERINTRRLFKENEILTLSPGLLKKKGGVGKVTIKAKKQKLSIELPWGEAMDDYANGAKLSKTDLHRKS